MLSSLIKPENIILNLESDEKDILFAEMVENVVRTNPSVDRKEALEALAERESKMNTCVKTGIAVPHASCHSVKNPVVAIGVSRTGIDYEVENGGASPDSKASLVHLVVLILFEHGNAERHLHILADCAKLLQNANFYQSALTAASAQEIIDTMRRIEDGY